MVRDLYLALSAAQVLAASLMLSRKAGGWIEDQAWARILTFGTIIVAGVAGVFVSSGAEERIEHYVKSVIDNAANRIILNENRLAANGTQRVGHRKPISAHATAAPRIIAQSKPQAAAPSSAPAASVARTAPPQVATSKPSSVPTQASTPAPAATLPQLPPSIVTTPEDEQERLLMDLLKQTPQSRLGVWLSQIVTAINAGQYVDPPKPNEVSFTSVIATLANTHQIDILDAANRSYIQSGSSTQYLVDFEIRLHDPGNPVVPFTGQTINYQIKQISSSAPGYVEEQITIKPSAAPLRPLQVQIIFNGPLTYIGTPQPVTAPGASAFLAVFGMASANGYQNNVFSASIFWPTLS